MKAVLWQSLWGQRVGIALLGLGLFGISMLIPFTYQAIGGAEGLEKLLEVLPEGLRVLLKAQGGLAATPEGYLAADYRHPVYLIILLGFAIASASGAVAREIERGTILLVLARPIPRHRYLLARVGSLLAGLLLLLLAALAGTWAGVLASGLSGDVQLPVFFKVQANSLLLALAVGGYSLLISALSNDGGRAISIAAGLTVVFFFLDFLSELWSTIDFLGPLSVFHYYDPVAIAHKDTLTWLHLVVLSGVALVGFTAAHIAFQRRDIAR